MDRNWKTFGWFKDRIGKRIFRTTKSSCGCVECLDVEKRGLKISTEDAARYLFDCAQNEMGMRYADKKPKTLKKGKGAV